MKESLQKAEDAIALEVLKAAMDGARADNGEVNPHMLKEVVQDMIEGLGTK